MKNASEALLEVRGLCVEYGSIRIVENVDLSLRAGERYALVGESGAGKSATARALIRLDGRARVSGSVRFDGVELMELSERQMATHRGNGVGVVLQDPLSALNPVMTIGEQITEPLRIRGVSRDVADKKAIALLDELGVANARQRLTSYPHEFSGGMRQRVAIAMALIAEPKFLIADEPTTALDSQAQDRVLTALDLVARERGLAVLIITHDLGVVAGFAERVGIMYAGRKIEEGPTARVLRAPAHPYTWALIGAVPRLGPVAARLPSIAGEPPSPARRPSGCSFYPRCKVAQAVCREVEPHLAPFSDEGWRVSCHIAAELAAGDAS
ncbi:MAG: ABC transporter ATP-binding protein [Candidatus Kaistia colombiensis]|nr:MAG: ABC transporter ATP-binding protein [Kaistia sp.]